MTEFEIKLLKLKKQQNSFTREIELQADKWDPELADKQVIE
jgi:hypothetical protein